MVRFFLKSSLFFQLNVILLVIFLTLSLFNLSNLLENSNVRKKVYKKISDITVILNSHSVYIHQNHPSFVIDSNFFLNFISKQKERIINDFKKINVDITPSIIFYENVPFVKYRIKLNILNFHEPDELVLFGYLKENVSKENLFMRWGLFENVCTQEMNNYNSCNLDMQMNWYCVSNRDRYLPEKLKYLHVGNISSKWVPFKCRW